MSNIYDKSSLVLIPSGTKTGKVYSQVPVSGDGDFTFTRSSAATRVNADGFIEKETQNLLLQSNTFDTTWGIVGAASVTGGQAGYDGTNNAWLLSKTAAWSNVSQSIANSGVKIFSVYVKANASNWGLLVLSTGATDPVAYYDLANGVVGVNASNIDAVITPVSGGWYRISIVASQTINAVRIYPAEANTSSGSSGSIYIQDAQLEQGLVARDYIETTTTAVEGGITDNVPRLDYTDSSCPALLLEPQRTNICPNSEDVSNWYLTFATATPNDTISPEGVQNAAKIVTSNAGCDVKLSSIPVSPSTTYTATFYCKLTSGSGLQTRFYDNTNGANIEYYDYSSQLEVGKWKRVERTFTTPAGCNNIQIWFLAASSSASVTAHYWGYQLEAGSYATSYIPTYGSSVTRNAETSKKNNLSNVLPNQTGTLYVEVNWQKTRDDVQILTIHNNSTGLAWIKKGNSTNVQGTYFASAFIGTIDAAISSSSEIVKIAYSWINGKQLLYINGVQAGTKSESIIDSNNFSWVEMNGFWNISKNGTAIKSALIFTSALSNEELAALTTI